MHTILVVDDEMIVCQGIKDYLERHQPGIGQVLTALNGYEALDYLRMERVDLVLTDIQMDGMNGIELMESILSEQPDIPVVVISAHDEFEYAQRCIRLGARDYLIKPVKLELLTEIVTRELGERHTRYKRLLEDSLKLRFSLAGMALLRTYMLNELLGGGGAGHADDAPFVMEQIGVELAGPAFAVMAVDLRWSRGGPGGRAPVTLRDRNLLKYAAVNIAEETLSDWRAVAFYGQGGRIMAILQLEETGDDRRADTASRLNMIGHALAANLGDYLQLDCAIGISSPRRGLGSLAACGDEALSALKWHGLYERQRVFYAEDFSVKDAQLKVNWQARSDELLEWMKVGQRSEEAALRAAAFVDEIAAVFEREDATAGIPLSIAYRVYSTLLEMKDTVGDRYTALNPLVYFQFPMPAPELRRRLADFLTEAADLIKHSMSDHDDAVVRGAQAFIRSHYRNKGLKIQDIAGHVHLSANYLSHLFKQITGETVWEFVTRLRMEEARHLLLNTAKKRYDIADSVGYESPEHFSRVFKRYYGESPNALRA